MAGCSAQGLPVRLRGRGVGRVVTQFSVSHNARIRYQPFSFKLITPPTLAEHNQISSSLPLPYHFYRRHLSTCCPHQHRIRLPTVVSSVLVLPSPFPLRMSTSTLHVVQTDEHNKENKAKVPATHQQQRQKKPTLCLLALLSLHVSNSSTAHHSDLLFPHI